MFLYLFVSATPSKPTITSVHFNRATAVVKWRPGYDGGYPQQLEVWYRLVTDNDYEWRRSAFLLASVTSYNIPDLQPEQAYYFSIRGINREGAGHFSDLVEARGVPPKINRSPDKAGDISLTPFLKHLTPRPCPRYAGRIKNAALSLRLGLPSTLICHENRAFRKRSSNRRNLKTPALRFRVDGKHFENGAFRKRWRHDNHVMISLIEFSSTTNPT